MRNAAAAIFYSAIARCEFGKEHFKETLELFRVCSLISPPESDLKYAAEDAIGRISENSFASWLKRFFAR